MTSDSPQEMSAEEKFAPKPLPSNNLGVDRNRPLRLSNYSPAPFFRKAIKLSLIHI